VATDLAHATARPQRLIGLFAKIVVGGRSKPAAFLAHVPNRDELHDLSHLAVHPEVRVEHYDLVVTLREGSREDGGL
jgi:hypothetical protein